MEELVLAVVILASMIAFTWASTGYLSVATLTAQLSPGAVPLTVGVLATPIAMAYVWMVVRQQRSIGLKFETSRGVIEGFAAMSLFVAVFSMAGFAIANALFVFVFLYRFYSRSWLVCMAYSVLLTGMLLAVFRLGLRVPL